jgi:signal transduction histidine kinase/CheY-like chemotaxis protein
MVLKHDTIGVVKDSISYNLIKQKYPNLKFVVFDHIEDALESLEEQNIKAILGLLPIIVYGINQNSYFSIRISGKSNLHINLSFMLRDKYKSLIPKINHELNKITTDEKVKIYDKWLRLNNFWTWEKIEFILFAGSITLILLFILTFILIRDIKRRNILEEELIRQKEKAEKAAKVKSEFLANMSHEIRTPLNAMFGFITILKESEKDIQKFKYLEVIEKCGTNLLNIINDILDFSKIEAGKLNIEIIEFNPKEELETIHALFASKASENNINLNIEEKNLKYMLTTDPTRLKQVVANLLSNAIKFTPANKNVKLRIEYDENKEQLYVEVKDEGIGIPKEKLNTIFEAFSQADNTTTRKYGGTGLGLSISSRLIKMLGGELKVESEVNKGSKFYFTIPAKKGKLITDVVIQKETKLNETYDYHILLVEDNKANQMFMSVILKKLNITFDIANDGIEAIELFKKNRYDLILMDENMPNMNGIEATKQIRIYEQEKNLLPTIIIALTANALEGDKERFILAGMNYYLSKPLNIDKFKEILNSIKGKNV